MHKILYEKVSGSSSAGLKRSDLEKEKSQRKDSTAHGGSSDVVEQPDVWDDGDVVPDMLSTKDAEADIRSVGQDDNNEEGDGVQGEPKEEVE